MKKIIILYSTGGMGHKKAAIALYESLRSRYGHLDVRNIDTLEFGNSFYKFLYIDFYIFMMTKAKWIWGILYRFTDTRFMDRMLRRLREHLDIKSLKGLDKMISEEKPDAIITTHFILPAIAGKIKKQAEYDPKLYVVITDYGPHSFWLSEDIDKYFVGTGSVLPALEKRGISAHKVKVTGIPTVGDFSDGMDAVGLREKYGLEKNKKTIFILSGGFGVGPMEAILKSLDRCRSEIQVITVCGHNKKAYDNINAIKDRLGYPVVLFGFTDKIAELMTVSDLMVTKAGGISVTEAMNMRLPMVLFGSIPGQETWNEKLLIEGGAALKAASVKDIPGLVDDLIFTGKLYGSLKSGIEKLRRPCAADDIIDEVIGDLEAGDIDGRQ